MPQLRPYLLLASSTAVSSGDGNREGGGHVVVGVALAKVVASPINAPCASEAQKSLRDMATRHLDDCRTLRGFLEYESEQLIVLCAPFAPGDRPAPDAELLHAVGDCDGKLWQWSGRTSAPQDGCARALMNNWDAKRLLPVVSAVLHDNIVAAVVAGDCRYIHCVAISRKIARKRLLVPNDPSRKRMKTLIADLPEPPTIDIVRFWWNGPQGVMDPEVLLHWLDISQDLKDQRQAAITGRKYAALFSLRSGIPIEQITKNVEFMSGRLLIKSRIRLDCTAMLLHRRWWLALCSTEHVVSVHLFVDSSPQWRGVELSACTVDIIIGDELKRCLAPVVSLSKSQLDLNGKVAAVLWQAYLIAGPAWGSLQAFCRSVCSVTSDMGTEKMIADCPGCLGNFFSTAFPNQAPPADEYNSDYLFEHALFMPGFRHMVDNWLQRGLSSMKAFPAFLAKLKSVIKFLRSELNREEVSRCLERDGAEGLAQVVRTAKLVSFANWRWGTLAAACKELGRFLESLAPRFDPTPFQDMRDTTEFKNVLSAFRSVPWRRMFSFVSWFVSWLDPLMQWAGGCCCHGLEDFLQAKVSCHRRGRRLAEAHAEVQRVLEAGLSEANQWTPGDFDLDLDLWGECQGAVRFTHILAQEKSSFLDKVPYLLSRLPEAGVRDRCIEQFDAIIASRHHRVSRSFLDPAYPGSLRGDIEAMDAQGGGMSQRLQKAIDRLRWTPLDDCVCEGPHAMAKRIKAPASAAKWPWVATSMRVKQSIDECRTLLGETSVPLAAAWSAYSTVVQPPSKATFLPRLKAKAFSDRVYKLEHLIGFEVGKGRRAQRPALTTGEENAPGLPAGALMDAREHADDEPDQLAALVGGLAGSGDPDTLGEGPSLGGRSGSAPVAHGRRSGRHLAEGVILMRQFFAATLQRYEYLSVPIVSETGHLGLYVFQILDLERRNLIVRPFIGPEEEAELDGLYTISLQPLQRWRQAQTDDAREIESMDTFVYLDPVKADIVTACGSKPELCKHIFVWRSSLSDVEGCVHLDNKQCLADRPMDLMSRQVPVLTLLDKLRERGFAGVPRLVSHARGCLLFDSRRISGKRAYLQCVLHMEALGNKGVAEFRSIGPQSYFEALLRGKGAVQSGLPALEYKKLLAEEDGDQCALASLEMKQTKRQRRAQVAAPAQPPQPVADDDSGDHSSIAGGDSGGEAVAGIGGANSDAESVAGPADEVALALPPKDQMPPNAPCDIGGMHVAFIPGRRTATHTYADRLSLRCANPAHGRCAKSRSMALLQDRWGARSAEIFLGAWQARAHNMSPRDHARHMPSAAEMQAYLDAHP